MQKIHFTNNFLATILTAATLLTGLTGDLRPAEAQGTRETVKQDKSTSVAIGKSVLGIGDRLKISFFELIDLDGNPTKWGAAGSALQTFYQRMDVTGEYAVGDDGTISLPRLGRFKVDGREQQELQSGLMAAFAKAMGRQADVNVTILERSPVYVVGPVKNPGAYKHVPGMTVLHVVALAGGLDHGAGNTSQLIESVREMERLRKAGDELKRLLAHRARLEAERTGAETLQPPAQLIAVAGEQGAQLFLAAESATLRLEQAKRRQQANHLANAVKAARTELDAWKGKITQLDIQRDIRKERLGNLKNLMTDGHTTQNGVINIRSELSDIEARRQDCHLAVVQAEARLAQAEQAQDRLALDDAANLAKAISADDAAIADAQQSLTSSEAVGTILEESNAKIAWTRSTRMPSYEIFHQRSDGSSVLPAQETSPVLPGDVLKISYKLSEIQDAGSNPRQQIGFETSR